MTICKRHRVTWDEQQAEGTDKCEDCGRLRHEHPVYDIEARDPEGMAHPFTLSELLRQAHVEIRTVRGAMSNTTRERLDGAIEKGLVWPGNGAEEARYRVLGTDSHGCLPDDPRYDGSPPPTHEERGDVVMKKEDDA